MVSQIYLLFFSQSSDAASLHALEVLMNEFFDSSTDNNRKREIGIWLN